MPKFPWFHDQGYTHFLAMFAYVCLIFGGGVAQPLITSQSLRFVHVRIKTTKFIVTNLQNSEDVPRYTMYNGTCGTCAAVGAPHAYELLRLPVPRSCYGILGAQYRQTTARTREALG
jgi:hypothetical protein